MDAATTAAQTGHRFLDILTLIALFIGPALAVLVQLGFESRKESRGRKIEVLNTLLAYRGRITSPEAVSALNRTALVFHGDKQVSTKLEAMFTHWDFEATVAEERKQAAYEKRNDLLAELISAMASSLGFKFEHTLIKGRFYLPKGMTDEFNYTMAIRDQLLAVTSGKTPLAVSLVEMPSDPGRTLPPGA